MCPIDDDTFLLADLFARWADAGCKPNMRATHVPIQDRSCAAILISNDAVQLQTPMSKDGGNQADEAFRAVPCSYMVEQHMKNMQDDRRTDNNFNWQIAATVTHHLWQETQQLLQALTVWLTSGRHNGPTIASLDHNHGTWYEQRQESHLPNVALWQLLERCYVVPGQLLSNWWLSMQSFAACTGSCSLFQAAPNQLNAHSEDLLSPSSRNPLQIDSVDSS